MARKRKMFVCTGMCGEVKELSQSADPTAFLYRAEDIHKCKGCAGYDQALRQALEQDHEDDEPDPPAVDDYGVLQIEYLS